MDSSDVSRCVQCHRIRGGTVAHMSANNVLVVSATKSEAAYVPQGYELLITGIGKVSAATAVASALARCERDDLPLVVNIGTAGALHAHHGGLYVPGVVINHDISSTACYLPTRQTRQRSRGRLGLGLARDDRCQRPRVGALAARQRLIEPAASGQACAVSINPVSSGLRRVSVSASTV